MPNVKKLIQNTIEKEAQYIPQEMLEFNFDIVVSDSLIKLIYIID